MGLSSLLNGNKKPNKHSFLSSSPTLSDNCHIPYTLHPLYHGTSVCQCNALILLHGRTNPFDIVNNFNDAITSRDPGRMALLMSDDHTFVDSAGARVTGRKDCIVAWEGFFRKFPDYKNSFEHMEIQGNVVITFGHSRCSDQTLNGPALWTATIKNNLVQEWRVYDDTAENRKLIGVPVL